MTLTVLAAIVAMSPVGSAVRAAEGPGTVTVELDQARLISLPKGPHTIVLGSPIVVRVTPLPDGIHAILTGTSFGETNMIVLDAAGAVVMESMIRVEAAPDAGPTIQRGQEQTSYACAPRCQVRLQLGDGSRAVNDIAQAIQQRSAQAAGQPRQQDPTTGRDGAL